MKNFFKKLSFVLASAMVITSLYAPAATSAAAKDGILLKGKSVKTKGIFVGGDKLNFDYKIGKHNNKGADGKWSVSDSSVIKVNKHGVVTAVGTGEATLMLKVKKNTKKGIKNTKTFKVTINAMARASKLEIPASDKAISIKVGEKKDIMPVLTNKVDGVDSTYNLFAKSSDDSVATVIVDGKKLTVEAKMASATPATITVFAAQKNDMKQAWDNKYKVEDSFTVAVKDLFNVEQKGANKILVTGENLVASAASYVVKSDKNVTISIKSVELNAAKTEAMLTTDVYQIPEGKYNLTHNGKEKADFMAEVAKTKTIEIIPNDKAAGIYDSTAQGYKSAKVYYKAFDQFGNDITDTTIPQLAVTGSYGAAKVKNGVIIFGGDNKTVFQMNITQFYLSIVDKNSQAHATANLVLGDASRVGEAEFFSLWDDNKSKVVSSISEADEERLGDFYLLFAAKDQYGKEITDAGYTGDMYVNLVSISNLRAVASSKVITVDGKKYIAYNLAKADTKEGIRKDEVKVKAIILSNGKAVDGTFNVTYKVKVDKVTVAEMGSGVYNNSKNELLFTALDTDGKVITDFDVLKEMNNDQRMSTGLFFEKDDKGVAHLYYKPENISVPDAKGSVPQPLIFRTMTNKFDTATVNIKHMKYPTYVAGIKSDTITAATRQNEIVIKPADVILKDQYGSDMTIAEVLELYPEKTYAIGVSFDANEKNAGTFSITLPKAGAGTDDDTSANLNGFNRVPLTKAEDLVIAKITASDNDETNIKKKESYASRVKLTLYMHDYNLAANTLTDNKNDAANKYVMLQNPNTEETKFSVYNVTLDHVKNVVVNVPKKYENGVPTADIYNATSSHADAKALRKTYVPEVVGTFDNNKKVKLVQDVDFRIVKGTNDEGTASNEDGAFFPVLTKAADFDGKTTKTSLEGEFGVLVLYSDAKTFTKKYTATIVEPHIVKASIKKANLATDKKKVAVTDVGTTARGWAYIADNFELEDQYGNKILDKTYYTGDKAPNIVFTFVPNKGDDADYVTVENNGTKGATFKFKAASNGQTRDVKFKMFFAGSGKTFEGTIEAAHD